MSLRRYPEYKDSSLDWLGHVPAHWSIKRLRFVAELNPSKAEINHLDRNTEVSFLPMEAIGDDGTIHLERTRPIREVETGYTYFRDGDVALAKITPCFENGKGALMQGLEHGIGFGTTELIIARPKPTEVIGPLLNWIFRSPNFRARGEASMYGAGGQKRVPDNFVRDFAWGFPPLAEQAAIAAFLDRETAKIDALIAEQEKLIVLLTEKRQATISQAVTKGLNPNAPMKDSGVAWLGEVPAHWEIVRIGTLFREMNQMGNDSLPVLSVSIHDGVSDKELSESELDRKVTRSEDKSKYKAVAPGDLAYNMMRAWQGGIGTVTVHGMVSPAYVVARPTRNLVTKYVEHLLRTPQAVTEMRRHSRGITDFRLRLYWDEFKMIRLALPPYEEQVQLASFIEREDKMLETLSASANQAITLLKERRSALIAAAVTGQIDVRASVTPPAT
jgi:type I restriction enzyme S subunit